MNKPLFKKVDAVVVKVPSIEAGLDFYCRKLGHALKWRKDDTAAVQLGDNELVLSTVLEPETDLLVKSVEDAVAVITGNGGEVVVGPEDTPVGKVAVVKDPFGNVMTLVDLSKGTYSTNQSGMVMGVG